jgi:hypothetical protein
MRRRRLVLSIVDFAWFIPAILTNALDDRRKAFRIKFPLKAHMASVRNQRVYRTANQVSVRNQRVYRTDHHIFIITKVNPMVYLTRKINPMVHLTSMVNKKVYQKLLRT